MNLIPGALKIAFRSLARRKFYTFVSLFGIFLTLLVLLVAAAFGDHTIGGHPPESQSDRTGLGQRREKRDGSDRRERPSHLGDSVREILVQHRFEFDLDNAAGGGAVFRLRCG